MLPSVLRRPVYRPLKPFFFSSKHIIRHNTIPSRTPLLPSNPVELKLRCTEFNQNGKVKTTAGEIRKSEFCQLHSLMPQIYVQ
ncbi:unnamed protein product [Cunninghamella blakesleeana]